MLSTRLDKMAKCNLVEIDACLKIDKLKTGKRLFCYHTIISNKIDLNDFAENDDDEC